MVYAYEEIGQQLQKQYQQYQQLSSTSSPIKFKTALEELNSKKVSSSLNCGIDKIDSFLKIMAGDRLAVIGNQRYSNMLVTRLCVNALLLSSEKKTQSRFFYTPNIIVVDAGNSCDFYQYVNFARQYYSRDVIDRVLNSVIITRAFTIYQMANILINQLPKAVEQYDAKMIVVYDLPALYVQDQVNVNEAKCLIREITDSIKALQEDVLVIVSLPSRDIGSRHDDNNYNRIVLPKFGKHLEIINNKNEMVDIKIKNNNIRRTHDLYNSKVSFSIKQKDLLTVSPSSIR